MGWWMGSERGTIGAEGGGQTPLKRRLSVGAATTGSGEGGRGQEARLDITMLEGEVLERLARAAHEVFCAGKLRDGWTYGPTRDNARKVHPLLKDYAELDEPQKEANRATVRGIPAKLSLVGLAVGVGPGSGETLAPEQVERMAEAEHDRWMAERTRAGFTPGEPTAADPKKSPYLVAWADLAESVRQIDRDLVAGIPEILARAGMRVVRAR